MAIYRLPPQQDLQKKITVLERQLNLRIENNQSPDATNQLGEIQYLYSDLKKIAILSLAAIFLQLLFYFFGLDYLAKINLF